jgi:hypothetical protein
VRLYAGLKTHWESVRVNATGSIPVVHPINYPYKSMTYDYFKRKYGSVDGLWTVLF